MAEKNIKSTRRILVIWRGLLIISVVVMFGIIGCASWDYEREEYSPEGVLMSRIRVNGDQLIIDSSIDGVEVEVSADGTRKLTIGRVKRDTDEEAVGAVAEGVTTAVIKAVVPVP